MPEVTSESLTEFIPLGVADFGRNQHSPVVVRGDPVIKTCPTRDPILIARRQDRRPARRRAVQCCDFLG